jgi:predicted deacylase
VTQETAVYPPTADSLPVFDIEFAAPSLSAWRSSNIALPGFWQFDGPVAGPHVLLTGLVHGNEIAGAVALERLLQSGPAPLCGRLTIGFVNLAAYDRFDPAQPTASRYVDEDMNRLWDEAVLDGRRQSVELTRARAIRRVVEDADVLLDLHSMLWPSEPLILCGPTPRGRALAGGIGTPGMVVADRGHASGRRLIDYTPFVAASGSKVAVLVEAGQHWRTATVATMQASIAGILAQTGLAGPAPAPEAAVRFAEVTMAITAASGGFSFVRPFRGGDVVKRRHTLIAMDGPTEIRTPHDDCLLVMPSLRPSRGHTAVRLARFS